MPTYAPITPDYEAKIAALSAADRNICMMALGLAGIGFEKDGANDCFRSFDNATAQNVIDDKATWTAAIAEFNAAQTQARADAYADINTGSDRLFWQWQRGENGVTQAQWQAAVAAIKAQYPDYVAS
jgi:hypothetical protein